MSIFASRSATTFKRVAAFAAAGAILSTVAIASTAQAARVHRYQPAASDGYGATPDRAYTPRFNGQCMTDEGQGRFYPCDGNGDAS
jgi:hypothetical protein